MTSQSGSRKLFVFLRARRAGEIVAKSDLLETTEWKESTLKTYISKNVLSSLVAPLDSGDFRILRDGDALTQEDVDASLTQVRRSEFILVKGDRLAGDEGLYELAQELGQGAVGHVWRAFDVLNDHTPVAVKIMLPRQDLLDPSRLANVARRFSREARNGISLNHPAVVQYRDQGLFQRHPFIVMALADGSVADLVKRRGRMPVEDTLVIIRACLNGLEYLHSAGHVHRDIKPHNILRFGDGYKLGDLGIVKWSDINPAITTAGTVTRASIQLGSWYYMAPEQRQSPHDAAPASDIYSLGVTWIEMLTGDVPDPIAVGARQYGVPSDNEAVNAAITKMLDFHPENRPSLHELQSTFRLS